MLVTEAATPMERIVVVIAKIVLDPDRVRRESGISRIDARNIGAPRFIQRADAKLRRAAVGIDHRAQCLEVRADEVDDPQGAE